jgi:hypothetical protein
MSSRTNWACQDHRHAVAPRIGDIDLTAIRGHRHAVGLDADADRRADHRIRRRVDHRDGAVETIAVASLLRFVM